MTLYHGTSAQSADAIVAEGWQPNSGLQGGNVGQGRYLYLTNVPENALWFAEQKGDNTVLEVLVEESELIVDPEDGVHDTVQEELSAANGLPGSVALKVSDPSDRFSLFSKSFTL